MVQKATPLQSRCGSLRETQRQKRALVQPQIGNILMLRATLFCDLSKESGARCRAAKLNTRL